MVQKFNIFLRVDSGFYIGSGHLMRCMTLCNFLKSKINCNINFILRDHDDNLVKLINDNYYLLPLKKNVSGDQDTWLGEDWEVDCQNVIDIIKNINVDLFIIDHYCIDSKYESTLRGQSNIKKILIIDDLANRKHDCDILLDQNLWFHNPYGILIPENAKLLLGLKYSILSDNFLQEKPKKIDKLRRIHIFFGGSDHKNLTEEVIDLLIQNNFDYLFDVVIGPANKNYEKIKNKLEPFNNFKIYQNVWNMAKLLNKADLCIGSSGSSSYERIYLGIPSIIVTIAENQIEIGKNLDKIKCIKYIGHCDNYDQNELLNLIQKNEWIIEYHKNCLKQMDNKNMERIKDSLFS